MNKPTRRSPPIPSDSSKAFHRMMLKLRKFSAEDQLEIIEIIRLHNAWKGGASRSLDSIMNDLLQAHGFGDLVPPPSTEKDRGSRRKK